MNLTRRDFTRGATLTTALSPVPSVAQSYEAARNIIVERDDALVSDLAERTKAQGK